MTRFLRVFPALLAFAFLWWLLADGHQGSWMIGIPAVLAASWAAHALGSGGHLDISIPGLLRFFPFFIWESLRGGLDVARRTLAPRMRIEPGFTVFHTSLQNPSARLLFTNSMCLLPGTLAADLHNDRIEVHMLDATIDPQAELARLERSVALIYREDNPQHWDPDR